MPDIFISYSRRDGEFGKKLHETFTAQKKDIWMDWEDIPLTADWWTEIRRGIETSDNFVLIMSPDSIGSPVCQLEIEYARRMNKRIVPIFHRDPDFEASTISVIERTKHDEHLHRMMEGKDAAALMEENKKILATLNWVFFKSDDNFDEKFYQLSQIVDADLTHIRQHTKLQVKALEWLESGKNASFILSGVELESAEAWLNGSADKNPQPTDLHREFIGVSRKVEITRHRLLRGLQVASVIAVALIVLAIGMALFSINQANTANSRADYAGTQVALAETAQQESQDTADYARTQVASAGIALTQSNGQVQAFSATLTPIPVTLTAVAAEVEQDEAYAAAMHLSGEAIARSQDTAGDPRDAALLAIASLKSQYTALADNTLLGQLDRFSLVRTFDDEAAFVSDSAFLPDGRLITADTELKLWDTSTGALIKTLAEIPTDAVSGSLIVSPDGSLIILSAIGTENPPYVIWSFKDDAVTQVTPLDIPDNPIPGDINFAPDGSPYLILEPFSQCHMWNPLNGKTLDFDGQCRDVSFSPDGNWIAVDDLEQLTIYPASGGSPLTPITHSRVDSIQSDEQRFAFSPDGRNLAVIDENQVNLWDYRAGRPVRTFSGHTRPIRDVMFTPDSKTLITNGTDGTVIAWDVVEGQAEHTYATGGTFALVTVSPDNQWLVTTSNSMVQPVRLWSLTDTTERLIRPGKAAVSSLAFSSDSAYLVGTTYDGVQVYDIDAEEETFGAACEEGNEFGGCLMAMQPDSDWMALMTNDDVTVADITTGDSDILAEDTDTEDLFGSLIFTPDGRQLIIAEMHSTELLVVDTETGEEVHRWQQPASADTPNEPVNAQLAVSPDGKTLLISKTVLTAVDLSTGEQTTLRDDISFDSPVAYSPDGKWLAGVFNTDDGKTRVEIFDIATWKEIRGFETRLPPQVLMFNADGTLLAFDNGDRALQVYTLADEASEPRVIKGAGNFTAAAFSPDGKWLAGGFAGGEIRLWNTQVADTIAYACERLAGYELNPDELRRYDLEGTTICP